MKYRVKQVWGKLKIIYLRNLDTKPLQFILPEELLEYFGLTDVQKTSDSSTFLFEKNIHPKEYTSQKLQSKRNAARGFFEEETVRDFLLCGKACSFKIKRRKWLIEDTAK